MIEIKFDSSSNQGPYIGHQFYVGSRQHYPLLTMESDSAADTLKNKKDIIATI